jgi:hypothetical protein
MNHINLSALIVTRKETHTCLGAKRSKEGDLPRKLGQAGRGGAQSGEDKRVWSWKGWQRGGIGDCHDHGGIGVDGEN